MILIGPFLIRPDCVYVHSFSDKPKIAIRLGRSINARQIKQGDDVYFECKVMAFPKVKRVTWLKNVRTKTFELSFLKLTK